MNRVALNEPFWLATSPVRLDVGAKVELVQRGGSTQAPVYSAETGGIQLTQPLTCGDAGIPLDENGLYGWVAPGSYDCLVGPPPDEGAEDKRQRVPLELARGDASSEVDITAIEEAVAEESTARTAGDNAEKTAREAADADLLPKAGGTMTGALTLSGDPTSALQAAPRQYVLAQIAALVNGAPEALDTLKELADALKAAEASDLSSVEALTALAEGKLARASNLSDLASATTARSNLGLGTAATKDSGEAGEAGKVLKADDPSLGTLVAAGVVAVTYSENAATTRPKADTVIWIGAEAVDPANAVEGDLRVTT